MKRTFGILMMIALFTACEELDPGKAGLLVPLTADQDSSVPSIAVNNTVLHSETFGDPTDPMVVFLHGGPGASDYRNGVNARGLANDGYFVVFYDQRGAGLSKRHDKSEISLQFMLDDLTAVIEYYRTSPTQKVFLLGHSWGAMLATAYINEYPTRISGAVLAEPGGLTYDEMMDYVEKSNKVKLFSEATSDVLYSDQFLTSRADEHEVRDYKLMLMASFAYAPGNVHGIEGPSPMWRYGAVMQEALFERGEKEGFDFTTNLNLYTTPVLILYSENNKVYGRAFAEQEAAYYPNANVSQVNDTGHEMVYFQWDNMHPLVLNYFNSLN